MDLFQDNDNTLGANGGLSNPVGDYYLKLVNYNYPSEAEAVNDNKVTFVLNDESKSTIVSGGIFKVAESVGNDIPTSFPVFGATGEFAGATHVSGTTDGQVAIFTVHF